MSFSYFNNPKTLEAIERQQAIDRHNRAHRNSTTWLRPQFQQQQQQQRHQLGESYDPYRHISPGRFDHTHDRIRCIQKPQDVEEKNWLIIIIGVLGVVVIAFLVDRWMIYMRRKRIQEWIKKQYARYLYLRGGPGASAGVVDYNSPYLSRKDKRRLGMREKLNQLDISWDDIDDIVDEDLMD